MVLTLWLVRLFVLFVLFVRGSFASWLTGCFVTSGWYVVGGLSLRRWRVCSLCDGLFVLVVVVIVD